MKLKLSISKTYMCKKNCLTPMLNKVCDIFSFTIKKGKHNNLSSMHFHFEFSMQIQNCTL